MRKALLVRDRIRMWLMATFVVAGPGWAWTSGDGVDPWEPGKQKGVVVEKVGEGSALDKAGLRPGDVVFAWERLPAPPANPRAARGAIESVFDWRWLKFEQAPRGTVTLTGERSGELKIFEVAPGLWDATVRASMPEGMLEVYARGKTLMEAEEIEAGIDVWRQEVAMTEGQNSDWRLRCWLLLRIGNAWGEARKWENAQGAYRSALEAAQDPPSRVALWRRIGIAYEKANDFEAAIEAFSSAQGIRENNLGESLAFAIGLYDLGRLDAKQGKLESAQDYFQRSLGIRQKLAPGSLDVAASLNNLGLVAYSRGDLARAVEYYKESLGIKQNIAPGSLDVAGSLGNLGDVASVRGDLVRASEHHKAALEIRKKLMPGSLAVARSLNSLGNVANIRGDLVLANEHYEAALEIKQNLVPGSLEVAASLGNLGSIAYLRGDLARAAGYFEATLEIQQNLAPGGLLVAASLGNLGSVAYARGDLVRANESFEASLEIRQNLASGSLDVANSLNNLGHVAYSRGDLARATEHYEIALEIKKNLAPGSLEVANSLNSLGYLAQARGDLELATEYFEGALQIQQEFVTGSSSEAQQLHNLASVRRKQSQLHTALALFRQALQAMENQVSRLGGSRDVLAGFRAQRVDYFRDTLELELELHLKAEAFHTLERSRAQAFLAQLTERDLVFSDVPEDLDSRRRSIAYRYDQIQNQLARLHPRKQGEEVEALLEELEQLRWEHEDVTEEIIQTSPKLGALRYPRPLDLEAARQALDPGTVMLSYSVGEFETHLFVLPHDEELRVETLPILKEDLGRDVQTILGLQKRGTYPYAEPLRQAAARLYQALIQPVESTIARSDRLLIVPDGPLHLLPFALLTRQTEEALGPLEEDLQGNHGERNFEYLVEWKPLHSVLSATVYAELRSQRRSPKEVGNGGLALAAFGDPRYPAATSDDLAEDRSVDVYLRSAAERGFEFPPLPYTREEVTRIAALYPQGAASTYLGAEATEERAKSVGREAHILHFATHGKYDARIPMNSYLALAIPEEFQKDRDNGLLQTWEIFEDVRLDADLVVLSACESGLGDQIETEGLIGLVRAFQFGGARTVAATLWQVDDEATAELMTRFYRHLQAGKPKDEALRSAQLELIQGPIEIRDQQGRVATRDLSLPYYWAAFQMIGDWQ